MSRFNFARGERVWLNADSYSFRQKLDGNRWRLEKEADGTFIVKDENELLELYNSNILKFVTDALIADSVSDAVFTKISGNFRDYPQKLQRVAKQRLALIRSVEGKKCDDALDAIAEISEQLGIKPPTLKTVLRWSKSYYKSRKNICCLVPSHKTRGNRVQRYSEEVADITMRIINKSYLTVNSIPLTEVIALVHAAIDAENLLLPTESKLAKPNRKYFENIIGKLQAYDVDCARLGKFAAKRKYREAIMSGEVISAPLKRMEIDHTLLDLIVVADKSDLPIGRPTLSVAIDRCTRCVTGYSVSYDPPSYVSVMNCLAHAVKPKAYVKEKYPEIMNEWSCWGLPQQIVVDNGAEFHSSDLEAAALSLLIDIRYCPVRQPWWKGGVERFFRTLNTGLIHQLPGTTFSNIFERGDYKSEKLAVVTESELNKLLHMWIIDVYHQTPHRQTLVAPMSLWGEKISSVFQTLPASIELLDINLASAEQRRLFHYGISLNGLTYNSSELQQLRRKYGEISVAIRWDKTNLGYVYVLREREDQYLKVPCTWLEYAENLSLWLHKIIREQAIARDGDRESQEKLNAAKARIHEVILQAMSNKKIKTRKKAARALQSFNRPSELSDDDMSTASASLPTSKSITPQGDSVPSVPEYDVIKYDAEE